MRLCSAFQACVFLILLPRLTFAVDRKQVDVMVQQNVETVACLMNLAGAGTGHRYGHGSPELRTESMHRFARFAEHPAVLATAELVRRGAWAPPVWVALNSSPFPKGAPETDLLPWVYVAMSPDGDPEEGRGRVEKYLSLVSQFYVDAGMAQYLAERREVYHEIEKQVTSALPDGRFIDVMEGYFGKEFSRYVLVPSPAMMEFAGISAARVTEDGLALFNVFGAGIRRAVKDSIEAGRRSLIASDYTFSDTERIRELSIHEFGHAFVNPVAERYKSELNKHSKLYEPIRERMTGLSYLTWWDCAVEHVIRAAEVRIARAMEHHDAADRLRDKYVGDYGFVYLPQLLGSLALYEEERDSYPTIDDYFPRLVEAFAALDVQLEEPGEPNSIGD